jgi:hypothetical protein
MQKIIYLKNKPFKQFRDTKYFCSQDGEIYSDWSQKILKQMYRNNGNKKYAYIDIDFGAGQKHILTHRIVYETWIRLLKDNEQVNHLDDNSLNNSLDNLYVGDQKENIQDCCENGHRVGNCWILTVFDKEKQETVTFCPARDFIEYSNHPCQNGNVSRTFTRNWFKKRYSIISYYLCKDIDEKKGVTTIPDECKEVD